MAKPKSLAGPAPDNLQVKTVMGPEFNAPPPVLKSKTGMLYKDLPPNNDVITTTPMTTSTTTPNTTTATMIACSYEDLHGPITTTLPPLVTDFPPPPTTAVMATTTTTPNITTTTMIACSYEDLHGPITTTLPPVVTDFLPPPTTDIMTTPTDTTTPTMTTSDTIITMCAGCRPPYYHVDAYISAYGDYLKSDASPEIKEQMLQSIREDFVRSAMNLPSSAVLDSVDLEGLTTHLDKVAAETCNDRNSHRSQYIRDTFINNYDNIYNDKVINSVKNVVFEDTFIQNIGTENFNAKHLLGMKRYELRELGVNVEGLSNQLDAISNLMMENGVKFDAMVGMQGYVSQYASSLGVDVADISALHNELQIVENTFTEPSPDDKSRNVDVDIGIDKSDSGMEASQSVDDISR
ncbi:hypothetical protein J6A31_04640 [bacterium]|nr:hypothetical protein [bacterium]